MAEATSSSGIDWSNIATTVFGQEVDKECGKIDFSGSKEKLTDGSAHMRAQAMADYACAYFKAIKENARTNLIIALINETNLN